MATSAVLSDLSAPRAAPAPAGGERGTARVHGRGAAAPGVGWLIGVRRGWLRGAYRALAVVVLCSLAAFQLESFIADICDGDATPAQLAAFAGSASDLPPNAAAIAATRATLAAVVPERGGAPDALAASPGVDAEGPGTTPAPTHAAHACHCVHAHGGMLPRLETVAAMTVAVHAARPAVRDLAPPSVTREPRLRPPLA